MKVRSYYLALFLDWLYMDFPLEKWFDVKYFPGHDGVFMEVKSKRGGVLYDQGKRIN